MRTQLNLMPTMKNYMETNTVPWKVASFRWHHAICVKVNCCKSSNHIELTSLTDLLGHLLKALRQPCPLSWFWPKYSFTELFNCLTSFSRLFCYCFQIVVFSDWILTRHLFTSKVNNKSLSVWSVAPKCTKQIQLLWTLNIEADFFFLHKAWH